MTQTKAVFITACVMGTLILFLIGLGVYLFMQGGVIGLLGATSIFAAIILVVDLINGLLEYANYQGYTTINMDDDDKPQ